MGVIADRTNTRWGKFRPWLLWTSLPFGVIGVLTFTTPNISPGAKLVYAWCTYLLLRLIYAVNNVPYASLTGVMTDDPDERNSIPAYRQIFANSAGFIVGALAIPMVRFFGRGDSAKGYQCTMGIFSALALSSSSLPSPSPKSEFSRTRTEDFGRAGSQRPVQEPPLGDAVSGHGSSISSRSIIRGNMMLPYFQNTRRKRLSLQLVQRLWAGCAADRRRLLHALVKRWASGLFIFSMLLTGSVASRSSSFRPRPPY